MVIVTEGKMQGSTFLPVHDQPTCRHVHACGMDLVQKRWESCQSDAYMHERF